jgi:ankyrin repeat protein
LAGSEDDRTSQDSDLLLAAANGDEVEVERLMEKSDLNVVDGNKKTALHLAAQNGHKAVV